LLIPWVPDEIDGGGLYFPVNSALVLEHAALREMTAVA